jgi:hypothetical protein
MNQQQLEAIAESLKDSASELFEGNYSQSVIVGALAKAVDAAAKEKVRQKKREPINMEIDNLEVNLWWEKMGFKQEMPLFPKAREKYILAHKNNIRSTRRRIRALHAQLAELQA